MARTILYPEWIIDGTGARTLTGRAVALEGRLIEAVAPAGEIQAQPGDRVFDLSGATLIPGMINNHVHAVLPGDGMPFQNVQLQSDAFLTVQAVHNLEVALRAGVTTVRDCGGRGSIIPEVRDAQARGLVRASRVISCGWPLTITGGHCRYFGGEADGEEGLRIMVRKVVAAGADFVKVMASGGGTPGSISQRPSYSARELRHIVELAHDFGRKVSAHCTNTVAIRNAVEGGVDFIEHATFAGSDGVYHFDPEVARRIADAGISVTPTVQVFRDMTSMLPDGPERERWRGMRDAQRDIASRLCALGVPLMAGSDAGWRLTTFDGYWKELDEMTIAGLSPVAAIHAATGAISRAFGYDRQFGTIEPGLAADLVAVDGDLANGKMEQLQKPRIVFQAGAAV